MILMKLIAIEGDSKRPLAINPAAVTAIYPFSDKDDGKSVIECGPETQWRVTLPYDSVTALWEHCHAR